MQLTSIRAYENLGVFALKAGKILNFDTFRGAVSVVPMPPGSSPAYSSRAKKTNMSLRGDRSLFSVSFKVKN